MKKLLTASFLGIMGLGLSSHATMAEEITVGRFATPPEAVPYMVFINPVFQQKSPLTYDSAEIADKGGAFTLTYINEDGNDGFDGYPSTKIGGFQYGGNYYSNQEY
ncbi:MAG: hypothetical protein AAF383_20440 [Cyanobacteria bacterium P01_A01_bin.83]